MTLQAKLANSLDHLAFTIKGDDMQLYYALTHNDIFDLGMHPSVERADYHAVDQFNMHQSPSGYIVVNHKELEYLKNTLEKRGVGVY